MLPAQGRKEDPQTRDGERRVSKLVSPVLGRLTNLPVAGDEVFGAARRFYDRLDGV